MKRSVRPLRLQRETLRRLQPDQLEQVAGGIPTDSDTYHNSCDPTESRGFFCPSELFLLC